MDSIETGSMAGFNQQFTLPDGRRLGYDETGSPDGKPLFYFHGTPSSRIEWQLFGSEAFAKRLHLRVIAIDRPGMGLSDFQPGRHISDWPADVVALADGLGIDRFAVLGYSGGGPYAAVCALALPERLTTVGIVSNDGPFTEPGLGEGINPVSLRFFDLAHDHPWLTRLLLRMMGLTARYAPSRLIAQTMAALPEPDKAVLAHPEIQQRFIKVLREALRAGPRGVQLDTTLMVSPWEFRPQEISLVVHLWHGEADRDAPPAMGHYLAAAIPKSNATFYPGEGHVSLFVNYAEDILGVLAA